jgi:hypothetical protein
MGEVGIIMLRVLWGIYLRKELGMGSVCKLAKSDTLALRPIVVEILLLIFHQQKIGAESGEEMMR